MAKRLLLYEMYLVNLVRIQDEAVCFLINAKSFFEKHEGAVLHPATSK